MLTLTIRTKLLLAFLAVTTLTLFLSAFMSLRLSLQELLTQNHLALMGAATQIADRLDAFVRENLNIIRTQSLLPTLSEYLELPAEKRPGSELERYVLGILESFQRRDHVGISSSALFDVQGRRLADTAIAVPRTQRDPALVFRESLESGIPSMSLVFVSPSSGVPSVYFASPVRNPAGKIVGMLRIRYNFSAIQKLVYEKEGLLGPGSLVILLDENDLRIADSHDRDAVFKPLVPLAPAALARLKSARRPVEPLRASEALPDFQAGVRNLDRTPYFTAQIHSGYGLPMICCAKRLGTRPWIVVAAQRRAVFVDAVYRQILYSSLLLFAVMIIAMTFGLFVARRMAKPIADLTKLAGRIAAGDLEQRAEAVSQDEIGTLAETFNTMTTALRDSREKLQKYVSRLEILLDTIPDAVFLQASDGRTLEVNQRCVELYGYSREEMLSLDIERLSGQGYTQDKAFEKVAMAHAIGNLDFNWVARRKDGSEFPVLVRLRNLPHSEEMIITVVTDLTEQKKLESQLLQARKLEAIGTLAGGIAHDFNNLLMGIQGCISLMMLELAEADPRFSQLAQMEELVKSGAGLTRQLLGYARGGRYELKVLDLNELLSRSVGTFGRTKKEVGIEERLAADLWPVEADQSQIEQIFLNLFVNAWQAMPGGGRLILETRNVAVDERTASSQGCSAGPFVKVSVTDTGTGMDEATMARVFEPFFTTKEMGRGTGLGLASVYGIVKNHGGFLAVESAPGQGSTFSVYLPASDKQPTQAPPLSTKLLPGRETILLVDDEETVRQMCAGLLVRLGYRVLSAAGGREAVAAYQAHGSEIDLVVLDMIMPEMSGRDTFEALKAMDPKVRVMLSSGYSLNEGARELIDGGCVAFIQKPFDAIELSQALRRVFD